MDEFVKLVFEILGADCVEIKAPSELESTVPLMLSDDYKERFKGEYKQLLIRYQKLCSYIRRIETENAPHDCPLPLLKEQRHIMSEYLRVLIERTTYEDIKLV